MASSLSKGAQARTKSLPRPQLLDSAGIKVMAGWRQAIELAMSDYEVAELEAICRSRSEPASRVERARILLAYRKDPSFFAVGRRGGAPSDGPALR